MNDTAAIPVLRARGLHKHYGTGDGLVRAVDGIDLEVASGETVAVMGPSGCGKSTLLHLLGGLDRPSSGECRRGRRIDKLSERALADAAERRRLRLPGLPSDGGAHRGGERRAVGVAGGPLAEGRTTASHGPAGAGRARRSGDVLALCTVWWAASAVAIARALSNEPLVVFADEPTGNLDSAATVEVLRLFESLHEAGQTLVIVTHDERIAATADRLISMRDGGFIDEMRLIGGTTGRLGALVGLEG